MRSNNSFPMEIQVNFAEACAPSPDIAESFKRDSKRLKLKIDA
jgi:hypothetical protein